METFLEFIFGNLAFLIVVIGGIVSLIKRANQNQKQPAKDKKIKPFIPQLGDFFEELNKTQEDKKQKPVIYTAHEEPRESSFMPMEVEAEPNPYLEKLREIEHSNRHLDAETGAIPAKKAAQYMVHHKGINKKNVIDGVIWGEILGPPRARNKHSYSYLKRG